MHINQQILFLFTIFLFSFSHAHTLKKVTLQLQWKHQFEFAGFYMAKEKGFYEDIGLDIDIKEWNYNINSVDSLIDQKSQYAILRPTSLIDISKGKKLIYLAAIYQSSPLVFLADKSSGIKTIKDFKNKKVMTTPNHNSDASIISMLFSQGIKLEDLTIIKHSFNVKDLLNRKTDLMASYISNEPFILNRLGGKPVIFNPRDYGFDFYNDILATSKNYYDQNKEEVKEFREATLKGWEYAFNNIKESVKLIQKKYNSQNKTKESLLYEANELKKLAYYQTNKVGTIDIEKLDNIYNIYKLLGLVKGQIDFNKVVPFNDSSKLYLNKEEKDYIEKTSLIKTCIIPQKPFEFLENGVYKGMITDYFNIFEKKLGTKFFPVKVQSKKQALEYIEEKKCELFPFFVDKKKKENIKVTDSYLKLPLVLATKIDIPFLSSIENLKNKTIGIPKNHSYMQLLKKHYPYLNFIYINNDVKEGLKKVSDDELYGYIDTLPAISSSIQENYIGELKITGKIFNDLDVSFAVRDDNNLLFSILQKSINTIDSNQKKEIFNRWVSVKYEKSVNYTLAWQLAFVTLLIFIVFLYWNRKLKKANCKLSLAKKRLEQLAITDRLTNIYNRHKLDEVLKSERLRSDRYNYKFGLIIFDIDYFKKVNDIYGHHIGDVVLQEFAYILKSNSRRTDTVGRWGGEEFIIIVPHTNKERLLIFAKHLKDLIEGYNFTKAQKITASIGVTIFKKEDSVESFVSRADNALYKSKKTGRNKVTFF
ncbi:diguanylate cyclase [Halarcobacter anaerophilus]|uniref:diguanylate cyclase n=1 Tax=Halarcobacter anaerophilus TaxID=877500 RepID=A0A4Q0XVZ1_9BACT|nr:diguanylate cyclase [Halarcobacter anaerophilus]QDF28390.1 BvgS-like domain-containing diguanylate cyclase (NMT1 domain) [Halarcobacter anaerophilus]RXJ61696.1 hypothetical protein CRV06_12875 [Halarcobacter anaerophilus]